MPDTGITTCFLIISNICGNLDRWISLKKFYNFEHWSVPFLTFCIDTSRLTSTRSRKNLSLLNEVRIKFQLQTNFNFATTLNDDHNIVNDNRFTKMSFITTCQFMRGNSFSVIEMIKYLDLFPYVRYTNIENGPANNGGGRHSSMDPSVTTILRPRVRIPSTSSTLPFFNFNCYAERTKINKRGRDWHILKSSIYSKCRLQQDSNLDRIVIV